MVRIRVENRSVHHDYDFDSKNELLLLSEAAKNWFVENGKMPMIFATRFLNGFSITECGIELPFYNFFTN